MNLFNNILINKRILGVAVFASVVSFSGIAAAAPAMLSASVNVRTGPGVSFGRIATFPAGMQVDAGPCRSGWCQVRNGRYFGWVSARYVRFGAYAGRPVYPARPGPNVIIEEDWGPDFGWYAPRRHGWRPDYVPPCSWRGCGPYGPPAWRRNWNPNWGVGPRVMRSWPPVGPDLPLIQPQRPLQPQRPIWGPGPAVGNTTGGGIHFGNIRPYHAGR